MVEIPTIEIIARLLVASVLGGLLGTEREIHGRAAGLRTHLLVSLAAAMFTLLSMFIAGVNKDLLGDPGRIAAQIVTGIGFLGAGAIIKEGVTIRGLTTAACLWVAAAIGMSAGAGHYLGAVVTSVVAGCALALLPHAERVLRKHSYRELEVTSGLETDVSEIIVAVKGHGVRVLRCDIDRDYENGIAKTMLLIRLFHKDVTDKYAHSILKSIEKLDISPKKITWHAP